MRTRIFFTACCLIVMCAGVINAQVNPSIPIRRCATMEQDSINRLRFPERGTLTEFEEALQQKIVEINARKKTGRTQTSTITIPIIVHVIYNSGEAIGTGANISQAQIQSQIEVLNEDYRKKIGSNGYNTNPIGADIGIEFCLTPVDEKGNILPEPGIDRHVGTQKTYTRQDIDGTLKPSTYWNANLFYNIWTLKFGGADSNLLGYAQFPDQSNLPGLDENGGFASTDGVVILYSSFGSAQKGSFSDMQAPYNLGRTLSHETGHWLGLRHIWGDGICADDFVSDTPTQKQPSSGCPTNTLSCDGSTPAMVQNYMDYSNDACMNIFTNGQNARIQAVLEMSPRRKAVVQANLCSPAVAAAPTVNFTTDKKICVLLGSTVQFTDLSTNFPASWSWTFEGGDPNTSTEQNPKVQYNVTGSYKVTLTAKNAIGTSDPLTIENYIVVTDQGLCTNFSNFPPTATPSILPLSDFGSYTGKLTGHNSLKTKAFSELFANSCGYTFVSGVKVKFGYLKTQHEDSLINITVWNARGPQGAPGSVIESKLVTLKQIKEDIQNNAYTTITFDRETPVFSRPFQVGVQINYNGGDSLAIVSTANGEATNATSWLQDDKGIWGRYSNTLGANIALDIQPIVGVKPSTQVSASKLSVTPGTEVILNGAGASIFVWNASDGTVTNYTGPQLIVHPFETTTYTVTGSGLDLCNSDATQRIYVSGVIAGVEEDIKSTINLYPNPGIASLNIQMNNNYRGDVLIQITSPLAQVTEKHLLHKESDYLETSISTTGLRAGLYLITFQLGQHHVVKKWVKL